MSARGAASRVDVEVAVVGGGPAGALLAARLAAAGHAVLVIERQASWTWHASGVFASPATMVELRRAGVPAATLDAVARPIPAMRVEAAGGATFRLSYGGERPGSEPPVGFDRSRLDPALLGLAEAAGAEVRRGESVVGVRQANGMDEPQLDVRTAGGVDTIRARVVVGADGHRSTVARLLGVSRPARLGERIGLTWHVADAPAGQTRRDPTAPTAGGPTREGRMVLLDGAYCGLAPVPGARTNIGIVLASGAWRRALAERGAAAVGAAILRRIPVDSDGPEPWRDARRDETIAGAAPLGHRVARRTGPGWILVGDAAGFLDPFTGEGLHRALASARLAAVAVERALRAGPSARDRELAGYERAMRRRFATKDLVSLTVQAFLARPALFGYAARRLARRERVRETMGLVMGDLVPASRALDPRFLAALLAP